MQGTFLFAFLFTIASFFQSFAKTDYVHPYHVGSVEINYNAKSKSFEITGRFFLDDLENGLGKKYGSSFHFNDEKYKAKLNEALEKYCAEYFKLKAEGRFLKVNYVGYEEDSESVNIFLESETVSSPKKIETAVSFLYNLFDDQINIVHLIVNGQRQSEKLTYPNRYLYRQF
ncbi:hypothetical protein B0A69_21620 [Chryseobacterium shigense]|uniref:Uncharacterized protein n=1 Tax=Chryseobacterium shigense TaxID=297244 RepID=A0A1N7IS43_9FLAO|nr:DUF6702 family protein [Chryseobacterium shigense]PQA89955.1 hypothetical protein B0A69_21620 [Chryseobacterium shigense]SIS39903.1 hypothetical protein SAMN05421639_104486 [Chryseobacterium shigense]